MAETMKVHAFSVVRMENSGLLSDLLAQIMADNLSDRVRRVGYTDLRVEHITYNNRKWYIDFGKFRDQHGPGKASRITPVEGFEFANGEMFCEEAACLYVEEANHLIIQYNHHGARAGAIQNYFCYYDNNNRFNFELRPKYDSNVDRKFRNRAATKKLIFEIDPRMLDDSDREAGTALTHALDIGAQSNSERIELTISAGRQRNKFLSDFIDRTADLLKSKAEDNPDAVTKLKVGVLENLDSRMEVLDLIAHRLTQEFSNMPTGSDLRFPRESRYIALDRAYSSWQDIL